MEATRSGVQILQVIDWSGFLIILFGFLFSVFYGVGAVWIFQRSKESPFKDKYKYNYFWWFHQVWINFLGSAFGWFMFFIVYISLKSNGLAGVIKYFSWQCVGMILLALIGMMGFLPATIWNLVYSLSTLIERFFPMEKSSKV